MNTLRRNLALLALMLWARTASAQAVPGAVSFTARLTDQDGVPVTGSVELRAAIYDAESGGARVWQEDQVSVDADASGAIVHEIGRQPGGQVLDASVFNGRALYLDLTINGEALTPRVPILSVPYAMRAAVAASAETLGELTPQSVALAAHDHDARYLRRGADMSCPTGEVAIGLRDVNGVAAPICQPLPEYSAGAGLALSDGVFSLASDSVSSAEIVNDSISASDIGVNAVTSSELASNSVGADEITNGAVGADEIADSSIGGSKLAAGVQVRAHPFGCQDPGMLTTNAKCWTRPCGASDPPPNMPGDDHMGCSGLCNQGSPIECTALFIGYLVY